MGKIVILDENTSNQIAAGEVVERPASVVKELVENSIDAGSTNISVEISNGGVSLIKVVDNGSGIEEDDIEIAFERHSTSKIRKASDLEAITSLGFRGEALASIASVSTVEVTSRPAHREYGRYVKIQGGTLIESNQTGCPVGTTFIVRELFYNTPARFKFLKKDSTEAGYVSDIVSRIALGNPDISFRLINNRNTVIHTPGNNDLLSTIYSLYGKETAKECMEVSYEDESIKITGYAGRPEIARSNRNYQSIYLNRRYIKNKVISSAIDEAYKTYLLKNKFAFIVLYIELNPLLVDVNVHPTKMEVRFSREQDIFRAVYHAVNNALLSKTHIRNVAISDNPKNYFKFGQPPKKEADYVQQKLDTGSKYTGYNYEDLTIKKADTVKESAPWENAIAKDSAKINNRKNEVINKAVNEAINEAINEVENDKPINGPIDNEVNKPINEPINKLIDEPIYDLIDKPLDKPENIASSSKSADFDNNLIDISNSPKDNCDNVDKPNNADIDSNETNAVEDDGRAEQDIERNVFLGARIIGQVFSTYILLQNGDDFIIIDQHAAHERIRFEELKEKYGRNESLSQYLLTPVVIEFTNQEIAFIEEERELLNKLGFIFESFGNNSIILRSVPITDENVGIKESFLGIVDFLMSKGKKYDRIIEEEVLYQIACKSAVKANKKLDEMEIKSILEKLNLLENPYTCPHGRPTVIKITKYEFEKMFKRIV
ncbi:DNA mismatch repair endonuclease MutL [Acetivibrio mesophilus]|uniref:DNA mismatch repair protein MutL n=1 Tax=Acetivibrio mesophilus TaxID=2487273 RepID=A0A4Q0I2L1_9FIRM|nr:DNA mismatch repair endonuclease MutL [Acetivibrio mesophilus]ODM25373.1 mannonate oxidoreductase [Clostridium sp. Bc-iso-3]RXE58453.1 DNA mismatch repair endonuclease MutL [Acetivibrio mesophilus]HHV28677.1 DNA mismatch repair endonuclease MutL [Clostridium sp.]